MGREAIYINCCDVPGCDAQGEARRTFGPHDHRPAGAVLSGWIERVTVNPETGAKVRRLYCPEHAKPILAEEAGEDPGGAERSED